MIRGFRKSQAAVLLIWIACCVIAVLVWMRNAGRPLYVPIVATVLLAGLGLVIGRLAGNIVANMQNVKCLGLLHMELDPQAFLKVYAPVPGRLPPNSLDHAVACTYLADGYAADGQFAKAADTLCLPENCKNKKQLASLEAAYWQKLCSYRLFAGDLPEARKALAQLDRVLQGDLSEKLLANVTEGRRLLQNRLAAQSNKQVETGWLEAYSRRASYKLLQLEIWQAQAQAALRDGDSQGAAQALEKLIQNGGSTFFPRWAREQKQV